jgi:hypothetical protein
MRRVYLLEHFRVVCRRIHLYCAKMKCPAPITALVMPSCDIHTYSRVLARHGLFNQRYDLMLHQRMFRGRAVATFFIPSTTGHRHSSNSRFRPIDLFARRTLQPLCVLPRLQRPLLLQKPRSLSTPPNLHQRAQLLEIHRLRKEVIHATRPRL